MAIPLRLMLPPVALVITRLLPDRMIPAGSGTLGDTVGEENVSSGAAVGPVVLGTGSADDAEVGAWLG